MSYIYETERPYVFTESGQVNLLKARDFTVKALRLSGAVMAEHILMVMNGDSSWDHMACVDRLLEMKEIREVTDRTKVAWQGRVFVRGGLQL